MPKFFDVHTHTQFAAFKDDYEEVIKRALDKGVWLNNVGSQKETSEKAVAIAEDHEKGVYATVGFHPIHAEDAAKKDPEESVSENEEFDYDFFRRLAENPKVVAIGECGLDYFRLKNAAKDRQKEIFSAQIKLAEEAGKPLMVHCRDAYPDLIEILRSERSRLLPDRPGISHFFTGSLKDAETLLEMGFSFSFGGAVTFAGNYDEVLRRIPLDCLLLETDAPYVAPVPFRGERNEPSFVVHVAEYIAKVKGLSLEEVARETTENALRIFAIRA
ncbi:MAG TPA: TatD family hydrolase [Candidatus Colwellbacteria bacterium]|jgi:TatD DNase family protein|nr:TatD family hydrolase [Candidatus Colwellbacteria bacterium]